MKFAYTIVYVADVAGSLAFFEEAFGFSRRFLTPEGDYGELDTGDTTLSFASKALALSNHPAGFRFADEGALPVGVEIALATDDVTAAHQAALAAGARELAAPQVKPWGQTVSFLRCPDGMLLELCSPLPH
ncbi:VOC family protein [Aquitalea sp. ASV11]|uniref:VOC family protein n=1 Tax=Aquitalea sp. ASV11 TaxID=2795103 RepID=UPI0018ED0105|nr:VOC family protein [Aquitalea sp. ASV11]